MRAICQVIVQDIKDFDFIKERLKNYKISILNKLPIELLIGNSPEIPTLIVGWENSVKLNFAEQNILQKKIRKNLYWTFSSKEKEKTFIRHLDKFTYKSIKEWLPDKFILYDPFISKLTFNDFVSVNIDKTKKVYAYFFKGSLYVNNNGNNYTINIKSLFAINIYTSKNDITTFFNSCNTTVFSYENIAPYINEDGIIEMVTQENIGLAILKTEVDESYFQWIPSFDMHKYLPFIMSNINPKNISEQNRRFMSRLFVKDKITHYLSTRDIALKPGYVNGKLNYKLRKDYNLIKVNYSNKRHATGRIVVKDRDMFNPQMLPREDGSRKNIISRFGKEGKIYVFDYIAFETVIALYLSENADYINAYKGKDLHEETAKIIFDTNYITEEQRRFSKLFNHALLYGAGHKLLINKLSIIEDPEYKLYLVKEFLKPILLAEEKIKKLAQSNGCVVSPWGTIVLNEDKSYAAFQNYTSCYASEIVVDKLFEIKKILQGKNSKFLFQVHDSLVFDINLKEDFLVKEIKSCMSTYNNMEFGVDVESGENYKELTLVL